MAERKTVMISSTARDLPEHRAAVRAACERMGYAPHEVMENLPALDADAVDASMKLVERSDVYIGVFAYRYGYVPDGQEISITEMEYNRAVELGKPRLVFFIHEDHPVTGKDFETGAGATKLQALKDRIGKQRVAAFFRSVEDLRAHVVEALAALAKEQETDEPDPSARAAAKLHRRTAIPTPPAAYIAHPYTLLQLRDLVGRQRELSLLTDWVAQPGAKPYGARIFCLVAIGGMGKSALSWKWFNQIAPNEMTLAGRLWWSFYESDADFESFLIRALCYVSGDSEEAVRSLPWQDREALLLKHLDEKPYLIALDGLERILLAYNRMDASRLADDEYDAQTANVVAGAYGLPPNAAQSFTGQHRLRQSTDPRAGAFLQRLAQVSQSRVLITTRLYPHALQLPNLGPRPGCFPCFLQGLSDDDAQDLARSLGVRASRGELSPIFRSVEGHPLLVQALASEVATYRRAPGDFAQWRADNPRFEPTTLPLAQSRSHILDYAMRGLDGPVREALHTLVGFRMPASYDTLEALLVGEDKAFAFAKALDRALTELEDRGLIGWDREANRYDAHPIVRGVVWRLTDTEDQRALYAALDAHFEPMATPDEDEIETLADLTPAIERYHTLVGLERYDDAYRLFRDRLNNATFFRLAAHRERIEWLERLFPEGVDERPQLEDTRRPSWLLNDLAVSYHMSGQPARAEALYRRCARTEADVPSSLDLARILVNLSTALGESGALREAERSARQSLLLARASLDESVDGAALVCLGGVLSACGSSASAFAAFSRARAISIAQEDQQFEGVVAAEAADLALMLGDTNMARSLSDFAWAKARLCRNERDLIRASLVQGRVSLAIGDLVLAEERLEHAHARARTVNMVEFELFAIVDLAELLLTQARPTEAMERLNEIWEPADRGPFPLVQADAFNTLTDIERAEGDAAAAVDAATKAYRASWCDGPPYAYHWGLEKAKAHLAALGAEEPDMPPFDESRFEPPPEIEINPKDEHWVDPDAEDW